MEVVGEEDFVDIGGHKLSTTSTQSTMSTLQRPDRGLGLRADHDLSGKDVFDRLAHDLAANFGDGVGQRDVFGADFNAILGVAALLDAAIAHQRVQALFLQSFAGGMSVEEPHLRNGRRADEVGLVIELRAHFHAAAAGDTAR